MAAPILVGVGSSVFGSNPSGTASVTVTAADLPAGVNPGDRIILACWVYRDFSGSLATPSSLPAGWTTDISRSNLGSGAGTTAVVLISGRAGFVTLPATLSPWGASGVYSAVSVVPIVWRDSYSYSDGSGGADGRSNSPAPSVWPAPTSHSATNSGFAVAAIYSLTAVSGLSPANGFSAVSDPTLASIASIAWDGAATITPPKWARTTGTGESAVLWAVYDTPDPAVSGGGWRVGAIHMGGNQGW